MRSRFPTTPRSLPAASTTGRVWTFFSPMRVAISPIVASGPTVTGSRAMISPTVVAAMRRISSSSFLVEPSTRIASKSVTVVGMWRR